MHILFIHLFDFILDGEHIAVASHDGIIYVHAVYDEGTTYRRVGCCSVSFWIPSMELKLYFTVEWLIKIKGKINALHPRSIHTLVQNILLQTASNKILWYVGWDPL